MVNNIVESLNDWISKRGTTVEKVSVTILLLVFFLLALPNLFIPIQRDEAVILDLASHLPRYSPDVENLPQGSIEGFYNVSFWYHPPLTPILMIPFQNIYFAKLVTLIMTAINFLFAYIFAKKRFGIRIAFGFLAMVCFNPDLIRVATFVWNDEYMFFFLFFGIMAYELGWQKVSLLSNVFASNCKISYPFLSFIYFGKNWRTGIKVVVVSALSFIPYWLWSWISTSDPLYLAHTWLTIQSHFGGAYRVALFPYFKKWYLYLLALLTVGLFTKKIDFRKSKEMIVLVLMSFLVYNNASWSLIGGIIALSMLFSVFVNEIMFHWKLLLVGSYVFLIIPQLLHTVSIQF